MADKEKWISKLKDWKSWILTIPFLGVIIWWLLKIIICAFFGICIL